MSIPDVVAIVGLERARAILAGVASSPALVVVEGGRETRELVRGIAMANIGSMRIPQWKLVDDIEAAPLFELIAKRFPRAKASGEDEEFSRLMSEWAYREAALYHFLAMVKDGRHADAERTLLTLGDDDEIQVPREATDTLRRAGLSEPLYRFLHAQLEKRPTLRAWSVYIEQAAFTGHSADALALIDRLLLRKDLTATLRANLGARRIAALLAAGRIDQASAAYKSLLATAPDEDQADADSRMNAAIDAAAIGRLTDRQDLRSLGLDFARRSFRVLNGKKRRQDARNSKSWPGSCVGKSFRPKR